MRAGPPSDVLAAGALSWRPTVSSWLGGRLLAGDIPIESGRIVADVSQAVPERLTITVPRVTPGASWFPDSIPDHPLARYGQELQVTITVARPVQSEAVGEWQVRVGRFLIVDWEDQDDGTIEVSAAGRLRRVADAKLTAPTQPGAGSTLASEARRLMPLGVSLAIDPALTDRACPRSMAWDTDRLDALREIADAWPALLRSDEWGQIEMRSPLPAVPDPIIYLRDGELGVLVAAGRSDTREGAYNQIIAKSSASDREDVQAIASQMSGPMAVDGPYGPVTREWSSPLIETVAAAQKSAQTILDSSILPTSTITASIPPDPRIDLDDPVEVVRDGIRSWGWVVGYDMPLTLDGGTMRVDVGVRA